MSSSDRLESLLKRLCPTHTHTRYWSTMAVQLVETPRLKLAAVTEIEW